MLDGTHQQDSCKSLGDRGKTPRRGRRETGVGAGRDAPRQGNFSVVENRVRNARDGQLGGVLRDHTLELHTRGVQAGGAWSGGGRDTEKHGTTRGGRMQAVTPGRTGTIDA